MVDNGNGTLSSGRIISGNGSTINLFGTGGGLYSNNGANNDGVLLNGAVLTAGNGNNSVNTISEIIKTNGNAKARAGFRSVNSSPRRKAAQQP